MVYLANNPYRASDIYHHGIKGQRWGVRRFQNPDGTLTEEGKRRYGVKDAMVSGIRKVGGFIGDVKESRRKRLISKNPKKYMDKMTTEELKDAVERIKLEQQYTDMFKQVDPIKNSRAKEFAKNFIENSASKIGMAMVNKFISDLTEDRELSDARRREELSRLLKNIGANNDQILSKLERNKQIANLRRDIRIAKNEDFDAAYMKTKNSNDKNDKKDKKR